MAIRRGFDSAFSSAGRARLSRDDRDEFAVGFWQAVVAQAQDIGQTIARPAPHEFYHRDALFAEPAPALDL